ncbi:TetR/AcrR family transcriptional regulator [Streptosporangium carneum]|uniref:TetR family transcriptional regulator n=1 Tax=Streptosporangium carneum TaxID=47481 RepID=A0A9W6I096_9ACTN|nr:TetR/AcrR family transcriptional regulator [Streptosporangium carneum]GLK09333.1 TetR family transcriptional regulator [Streptosporangium carneum]
MSEAPTRRGSLRERKRAATIDEIKSVALDQLAADLGQMTLRGVAREVGLTVQSLYNYFPSREDLITALVADAHNALADAVQAAGREHQALPAPERLVRVALTYRRWAVEHRARFLLIYGTPVPGYRAPEEGPTTGAARRLGATLIEVVFGDWSAAEMAGIRRPGEDARPISALATAAELLSPGMPPAALGLGLDLWGRIHGLVMLEILGHLPWLGPDAEANYRDAMTRAAADVQRVREHGA